MKQRIVKEIAQHRQDGQTVAELHLWSQAAIDAITKSAEYSNDSFNGIPVVLLDPATQVAGMDFIVIVEG